MKNYCSKNKNTFLNMKSRHQSVGRFFPKFKAKHEDAECSTPNFNYSSLV